MDWKQEALKRIDLLAEKLGVASAHLWGVLVRQAYAEAIGNIIVCICLAIGITVAVRYAKWAFKQPFEQDPDFRTIHARSDGQIFQRVIAVMSLGASLVAFGVITSLLYEATLAFINPEYYALRKVLEVLK